MKYIFSGILLAAIALFAACGSTANNGDSGANVSGNWSAALVDTNGNAVLTFTTTLVQNSNGTISTSNLTFTTNSACFVGGGTETGAITISGTTSGVTSAGVQLTINSTGQSAGNTLQLSGSLQNSVITGTWSLNGGAGCTGNGTFTMTHLS
ncbi:MAG TPA: hypothetical protein VGL89_17780 [Candidatus Koribacter sp.]|jgi:hypothetical protein